MDHDLIPRLMGQALIDILDGRRTSFYTPQSFVMRSSGPVLIRGNLWCPSSSGQGGRSRRDSLFSYYVAHDHNYNFITVGYWGSGYETEIFRINPDLHDGRIGATVPLESEQRATLSTGYVMAYEAHSDIHIQLPQKDLSISINIMVRDRFSDTREQYIFDIDKKEKFAKVSAYPDASPLSVHASLVQMAGLVSVGNLSQRLFDISANKRVHPRIRHYAFDALISNPEFDREESLSLRDKLESGRGWEGMF